MLEHRTLMPSPIFEFVCLFLSLPNFEFFVFKLPSLLLMYFSRIFQQILHSDLFWPVIGENKLIITSAWVFCWGSGLEVKNRWPCFKWSSNVWFPLKITAGADGNWSPGRSRMKHKRSKTNLGHFIPVSGTKPQKKRGIRTETRIAEGAGCLSASFTRKLRKNW